MAHPQRAAWFDGPIAAPRFSPRQTPSPRSRPYTAFDTNPGVDMGGHAGYFDQGRPTAAKELYYNTVTARAVGKEATQIRFWDAFVAKQNSRAVDTMTQYSAAYHSPRPSSVMLSPRSLAPRSPRTNANLPPLPDAPTAMPPTATRAAPAEPFYWNKPGPPESYRKVRPGSLGPAHKKKKEEKAAAAAAATMMSAGAPAPSMAQALEDLTAGLSKKQIKGIISSSENAVNSHFTNMWNAFKSVDVDMSGRVNREELARALQLWGVANPHGDLIQAADAVIKACDSDGDGSIDYKEFVNGLARDKFVGAAPVVKKRVVGDPLADPLSKLKPGVTAEDLVNAHTIVRERLLLKHDTIHKAFKYMDQDGSGYINRSEFETCLKNMNVSLRKPVLDSLLDIIDVEDDDDGGDDHDIGFREFARVMNAADLFKMRALAPRPTKTHVDEREKARQEALEYLRPGVQCEELRKFQEQVKNRILSKYGKHSFSSAFKWIDADRTGSISRDEFKQAMRDFNLSGVKENILDTLCDFIDQDGSGSFGYREFAQVLSADDVMQWAPKQLEKPLWAA